MQPGRSASTPGSKATMPTRRRQTATATTARTATEAATRATAVVMATACTSEVTLEPPPLLQMLLLGGAPGWRPACSAAQRRWRQGRRQRRWRPRRHSRSRRSRARARREAQQGLRWQRGPATAVTMAGRRMRRTRRRSLAGRVAILSTSRWVGWRRHLRRRRRHRPPLCAAAAAGGCQAHHRCGCRRGCSTLSQLRSGSSSSSSQTSLLHLPLDAAPAGG